MVGDVEVRIGVLIQGHFGCDVLTHTPFCQWLGRFLVDMPCLLIDTDHFDNGVLSRSPSASHDQPLIFQGIAYSIYAAAMWPSIPIVVEDKHVR